MIDLFVYGTLMFPQVVTELTGLTPTYVPAVAYNTTRLGMRNQVYPGLVNRSGSFTQGYLLRNLDDASWCIIEAFEGDEYERGPVTIETAGNSVRTHTFFVRTDCQDRLLDLPWDPEAFLRYELDTYLTDCRSLQRSYHHHRIDKQ